MTPKEKAVSIYESMYYQLSNPNDHKSAIKCAKVAVNLVMQMLTGENEYWRQVIKEIEKL